MCMDETKARQQRPSEQILTQYPDPSSVGITSNELVSAMGHFIE